MRRPHLGIVIGATVLSLAMAGLLGVLLPTTDAALGSEAAGDARKYTPQQIEGRKIYVREGCITCHTQMVRDAEADGSLGALSLPGHYLNEAPNLIGLERFGPDLFCVGDRFKSANAIAAHLRNPAKVHEGSAMPSYAYLTSADIRALAAYLFALKCGAVTG